MPSSSFWGKYSDWSSLGQASSPDPSIWTQGCKIEFLHMSAWWGGLVTKSCLTLATPWTVACQAPLSMQSPRQGYWSGLLFPLVEDLSDTGIEPRFPALQVDSLLTESPGKPCGTHLVLACNEKSLWDEQPVVPNSLSKSKHDRTRTQDSGFPSSVNFSSALHLC